MTIIHNIVKTSRYLWSFSEAKTPRWKPSFRLLPESKATILGPEYVKTGSTINLTCVINQAHMSGKIFLYAGEHGGLKVNIYCYFFLLLFSFFTFSSKARNECIFEKVLILKWRGKYYYITDITLVYFIFHPCICLCLPVCQYIYLAICPNVYTSI